MTALRIEGTAGRKENSALSPQFAVVPMTLSDCRTRQWRRHHAWGNSSPFSFLPHGARSHLTGCA
jgi:hypothetical protein